MLRHLALNATPRRFGYRGVGSSSGGGSSNNEPSGYTMWRENPFNVVAPSGWALSGSADITTDAAAPESASNVLRFTYPVGFEGGYAPGSVYVSGSPDTVDRSKYYFRISFKLSSNWQLHSSTVNKLVHFYIGLSNKLYLEARGSSGTPELQMGYQNLSANYQGATSGHMAPNQGQNADLVLGTWYTVEIIMTANTSGQSDGRVEMWRKAPGGNFIKTHDHQGIQFTSTASLWEHVSINPTWGGSGGTVSNEMYLYVDHCYISRPS